MCRYIDLYFIFSLYILYPEPQYYSKSVMLSKSIYGSDLWVTSSLVDFEKEYCLC